MDDQRNVLLVGIGRRYFDDLLKQIRGGRWPHPADDAACFEDIAHFEPPFRLISPFV
jgi:hypothetical protein